MVNFSHKTLCEQGAENIMDCMRLGGFCSPCIVILIHATTTDNGEIIALNDITHAPLAPHTVLLPGNGHKNWSGTPFDCFALRLMDASQRLPVFSTKEGR